MDTTPVTKHKTIYRHTEGKYKDGKTSLVDKKIYDSDEGFIIKLHKNKDEDSTTLFFKSQKEPNKYTFIKQENGKIFEENNLSFDDMIERIKSNNVHNILKFAIDYFVELGQKGGSNQCGVLHGGRVSGSSDNEPYVCKVFGNHKKCTYLNLEDDINNNKYITRKSVSRMQGRHQLHSRKLSKKMSKKLSKKMSKNSKSSRTNYKLPKSIK
jgi:hypothetical protein